MTGIDLILAGATGTAIWMLLLYLVIKAAVREGILAADRTRQSLAAEHQPDVSRLQSEAQRIGLQLRPAGTGYELYKPDTDEVVMSGSVDDVSEALTR